MPLESVVSNEVGTLGQLEGMPPGRRIAITGGPDRVSDNLMLHHFLGIDLRHTLHYVAVTASGAIEPFGPERRRDELADYESWARRLETEGITHVMSFPPRSVELRLMEQHPERFEAIVTRTWRWGLYRVVGLSGAERDT
jgi:hypothetical protein